MDCTKGCETQVEGFTWRPGRIHCDALKGYLGDPRKGGGPVEKQVVKNWKAFVSRHEDTFSYDDVSKVVSLCASVADTATETRVVNRLKTRLQGGPCQAAVLISHYYLRHWCHNQSLDSEVLFSKKVTYTKKKPKTSPNIQRIWYTTTN